MIHRPKKTPKKIQNKKFFANSSFLLVYLIFFIVCLIFPFILLAKKSFLNLDENFVGLENFQTYFSTPGLISAFKHTLFMGFTVTALCLSFAFIIAYSLNHTRFIGRKLCRNLSLIPLFTPSIFPAVGLIYLLGNQGLLRGLIPGELYGPRGIVLASIVYTLPHAVILLTATLRDIDHRLYLAARTLGASPLRCFFTVTLPGARYGLVSAAIVVFILTITDFGIPKVLGGDYAMLSTEIYKQVIGQHNISMGATVSLILLLPSIPALALDRWARKKQHSGFAQTVIPRKNKVRDYSFSLLSLLVIALPIATSSLVIWGSFINFWPYDFSLTLSNFEFQGSIYGLSPLVNSLKMALTASIIGLLIVFSGAYLVERCQIMPSLTALYRFFAILPLSIPGTVLGLSYIIAFNKVDFDHFLSPFTWMGNIYGTTLFMAINCIIHFFTVCHLTASGSLARLSRDYELAGKTLGVRQLYTFGRVIIPLQKETIIDISFYIFVNSLTTISAVVFLYSPETIPASVAILQMLDAGEMAEASAMGTLLLGLALGSRILQLLGHQFFSKK